MSRSRVLVLGGNFGGLTTAISVKHLLEGDVDVTVVSASDRFLYTPSLIWLPFGKRTAGDITFPVAPTFEHHGVEFVHAEATEIDPAARRVHTAAGAFDYDYLVVATGYRGNHDVIPGLGEDGHAHDITTLEGAIRAGAAWARFVNEPGDVVVGATQGAGCFGAAYEYLFNLSHRLRKAGIKRQANVTFVTSEPFLGHFGIGGLPHGESMLGMFLRKERITAITEMGMDHVDDGRLVLEDGRSLPFAHAMIIPPFEGQDVVKKATALSDAKGYVPVRDTYQSVAFDDVYAVGVAAAVDVPWQTAHAAGVPKTGFPTETQAHVAARNIAAQIRGEAPTEHKEFGDIPAVCVMDAGNNGVVILADRMLPPRKHGVLVPGPHAHAMKVAFEKYFLWKARHGYVDLP